MAKRPKGAAIKGVGDPVREQRVEVVADADGSRRERRLWAKVYGKRKRPSGVAGR